jgi:hypothetical protein
MFDHALHGYIKVLWISDGLRGKDTDSSPPVYWPQHNTSNRMGATRTQTVPTRSTTLGAPHERCLPLGRDHPFLRERIAHEAILLANLS